MWHRFNSTDRFQSFLLVVTVLCISLTNGLTAYQNEGKSRVRRQANPRTTCICVPSGQCTEDGGGSSDGSGVIDIRIVNNGISAQQMTTQYPPEGCQWGLEQCCIPGPYRCGIRYPPVPSSPQPMAGQAAYGAFPWQGLILTTNDVYLGSGALIDERHLLTAAHKIVNLPINSFRVRMGDWDSASTTEPIPAQEFLVTRVFIHPNFNPNNLQNDIAVIRLSPNVHLGQTPTITTACLPLTMPYEKRCYVSGWGKDDFGPNGRYQNIQKMVDVIIHRADYCQSALTKTKLGPQFIFNSTSFICAGGEEGKDACTGDGGSPLVCEINGRWSVVGLVAWGIGCATGGVPGVYVNVLTYMPWIRAVTIVDGNN